MIDFNSKKGFICDMDGVIYHGNRILPGVAEFIDWLHRENKEFLFLTNNSGHTPRELQQKLARMGLDVSEEHFYTSALATAAFLKEQNSDIKLCKKESSCVYRFEDKRALALQKTVAAEEGDANEIIVIEDEEAPSVIALKEEEEDKPARRTLRQAPAL